VGAGDFPQSWQTFCIILRTMVIELDDVVVSRWHLSVSAAVSSCAVGWSRIGQYCLTLQTAKCKNNMHVAEYVAV